LRLIEGFGAPTAIDRPIARQCRLLLRRACATPVLDDERLPESQFAAEAVVRAPADGYTLLLVTASNAINATLYDKLGFNFVRDIAPVAGLIREPNVMVLNPSVPAKTVPDFIAYAKANPRKIDMASSGNPRPRRGQR
jgi:Tripartite tricarboxylate transporter family receptor